MRNRWSSPRVQPRSVRTRKLAPELRGVGGGGGALAAGWRIGWGRTLGGPVGSSKLPSSGLKASAHPLSPRRAEWAHPHRSAPAGHALASTAPARTPETHTGTRARSHTPPSAQRLLPAAPPPVEPDSGMRAPERRLDGPGQEPSVPAGDQVGLASAGAGAGTPCLRPTPPRPPASAHLGTGAWSPKGREDPDCRACELAPRCRANPPGGGCRVPAGR